MHRRVCIQNQTYRRFQTREFVVRVLQSINCVFHSSSTIMRSSHCLYIPVLRKAQTGTKIGSLHGTRYFATLRAGSAWMSSNGAKTVNIRAGSSWKWYHISPSPWLVKTKSSLWNCCPLAFAYTHAVRMSTALGYSSLKRLRVPQPHCVQERVNAPSPPSILIWIWVWLYLYMIERPSIYESSAMYERPSMYESSSVYERSAMYTLIHRWPFMGRSSIYSVWEALNSVYIRKVFYVWKGIYVWKAICLWKLLYVWTALYLWKLPMYERFYILYTP